jgi:hypothetical protein
MLCASQPIQAALLCRLPSASLSMEGMGAKQVPRACHVGVSPVHVLQHQGEVPVDLTLEAGSSIML